MSCATIKIFQINMSSSEKRRKVDAECRMFKNSWTEAFFVIEQNETSYVTKKYQFARNTI